MKQDTVLIIGGGVVGVCSAYFLAGRGRQVIIVDQGGICAGSSYGNSGLVVPSHAIPLAAPGVLTKGLGWLLDAESPFYIKPRLDLDLLSWLLRFSFAAREGPMRKAIPVLRDLGIATRALWDELARTDGLQFDYQQKGMMLLFRTRQGFAEGREEAHILREAGINLEVLDGDQIRHMEPTVRPEVVGGIHFLDDAHHNPASFVRGLAHIAEGLGVHIKTGTEVLGFETSDGRISTVRTTRGDFHPNEVVLAAGAWSPVVARDLRINVPIQAAKGYSLTFKRPEMCPTYPMLLSETRVAVTPMGPLLRFGGTLELAGIDLSINQRRVGAIRRGAGEYLFGTEGLELIELWRGLRPCTPDGVPIIGRSARVKNLIIAGGHATTGQSLGPITGKLVSQIVCGDAPAVALAALSPERFN
ncbi:MAG: FAD-dependent oxidoreductase [Chloroflexi bacterium]|nr:FAD-dependent oxidoreductase [Chloroflexota bacterium]